jgi:uncharacterized protein (TIGR03435 family)
VRNGVAVSSMARGLLERRGRKFSARPSLASLGVIALLLAVSLGVGGLIPAWIAVAHTKANAIQSSQSSEAGPAASSPRFEVASIRPGNTDGRSITQSVFDPPNDGRFYAENITAKTLITIAYNIQGRQILGGPGWLGSLRYDFQAKSDTVVNQELRTLSHYQAKLMKARMLQSLLRDRFKLSLHRETKIEPVYALVIAKHGPKLQEVKNTGAGTADMRGPARTRHPWDDFQFRDGEYEVTFHREPILDLAHVLSGDVGRRVLDRTGLGGTYNFTLSWAQETMQGPVSIGAGPGSGAGSATGTSTTPGSSASSHPPGPSIFTAIQQQLGLRLKPEKGPIDFYVIDHIEPPTPN